MTSSSQVIALTPRTKRFVLAQILVCSGCCCGQVEDGKPEVPVEWLKSQWRAHKLSMRVDLTIPYCLGPCDACNVVCVLSPQGSTWLGGLGEQRQYEALRDWALECAAQGQAVPLPESLLALRFERWGERA